MQQPASLQCSVMHPHPVPLEEVHMASLRVRQELFLPLPQPQPVLIYLRTPLRHTIFGFLALVWPETSFFVPHLEFDPFGIVCPVSRNTFEPAPWALA